MPEVPMQRQNGGGSGARGNGGGGARPGYGGSGGALGGRARASSEVLSGLSGGNCASGVLPGHGMGVWGGGGSRGSGASRAAVGLEDEGVEGGATAHAHHVQQNGSLAKATPPLQVSTR